MTEAQPDVVVSIERVSAVPHDVPGQYIVTLHTNHGDLEAVLVPCEGRTGCAIFVGDEGAEGVYRLLSEQLVEVGVSSLRLRPRVGGELFDTIIDVLAACSFLKGIGGVSAVVVGHSYAGAVAIRSGLLSPFVCAVAALAPQLVGTQGVEQLDKPLLLIHGSADQVLLPLTSEDIHARAPGSKQLVIVDGADHAFRGEGPRLTALLYDFIASHASASFL
ncbi:MAG: alpha/beta hydrolase [Chloroflexi bacterium]|nr:alpha/beta hydrolase [Chloroflexota bacterium]